MRAHSLSVSRPWRQERHMWHFMVKDSWSDWLHHSTSQDSENFNRNPRCPITLNLSPCDPTSTWLYNLPKEYHQQRTKHPNLWVCGRDSSHLNPETEAKWEHSVGLLGSREIESTPALKTIWRLFKFFCSNGVFYNSLFIQYLHKMLRKKGKLSWLLAKEIKWHPLSHTVIIWSGGETTQ